MKLKYAEHYIIYIKKTHFALNDGLFLITKTITNYITNKEFDFISKHRMFENCEYTVNWSVPLYLNCTVTFEQAKIK